MNFIQEADEFAESLGMVPFNANDNIRTYHSNEHSVAMTCYLSRTGEVNMELLGLTTFLCLKILSGKMQFKHPRTKQYIKHIDALVRAHETITVDLAAAEKIDTKFSLEPKSREIKFPVKGLEW